MKKFAPILSILLVMVLLCTILPLPARAMRIQHNITAMNAYRNYMGNTSALTKNLEKLSPGYQINRAGDDAAGQAQDKTIVTQQARDKDGKLIAIAGVPAGSTEGVTGFNIQNYGYQQNASTPVYTQHTALPAELLDAAAEAGVPINVNSPQGTVHIPADTAIQLSGSLLALGPGGEIPDNGTVDFAIDYAGTLTSNTYLLLSTQSGTASDPDAIPMGSWNGSDNSLTIGLGCVQVSQSATGNPAGDFKKQCDALIEEIENEHLASFSQPLNLSLRLTTPTGTLADGEDFQIVNQGTGEGLITTPALNGEGNIASLTIPSGGNVTVSLKATSLAYDLDELMEKYGLVEGAGVISAVTFNAWAKALGISSKTEDELSALSDQIQGTINKEAGIITLLMAYLNITEEEAKAAIAAAKEAYFNETIVGTDGNYTRRGIIAILITAFEAHQDFTLYSADLNTAAAQKVLPATMRQFRAPEGESAPGSSYKIGYYSDDGNGNMVFVGTTTESGGDWYYNGKDFVSASGFLDG